LLAALHAACFGERWDEAALASLLAMPGAHGFLAEAAEPLGFVLLRVAADEAEIISIGVAPAVRRMGIGRCLLKAAEAAAATTGAESLFLEVAADNFEAHGLYSSLGFTEIGRRAKYYRRTEGAVAACVLAKKIVLRQG
jgi:[ribosomal protein S18]-alanine N-acetyltransferase